jgi:hypothetical protein
MADPTPTPTVTQTPTPSFTPIPKKPRIEFDDGYNLILKDAECCCPKKFKVSCSDLTAGKYYTVKLKNTTNTRSKVFPRSIGFLAKSDKKNLEFYTQFECDINQKVKPNTTYSLITRDATTGSIINPRVLNYKVTRITSGTNELNTELFSVETDNYQTILTLDDSIVPSIIRPIRFNILVTGSSIVTSHKQVILDKTGDLTDTISVVNLDSPVDGVVVSKKMLSQGDSGLSEPYTIMVPQGKGKDEKASISFDANTKLYDSNGEALVGDISITVAHFSNTSEESLNAFPGGFAINGAIDQDGSPIEEDFYFYSAGFLSIEATDSDGRVATSLSRNYNIFAEVNSGTINYGSTDKSPVQPGTSIPLWSISRDGVWKNEGNGILDENLALSFDTNHFTTWNWDWKADTCATTTINIPSYITNQANPVYVSLYADPSRNAAAANAINARFPIGQLGEVRDKTITMTRYPRMPILVSFYKDRSGTMKLGEIQIDNCNSIAQPGPTPTMTPTITNTPSITPTETPPPSNTPTNTPTVSVTPTITLTPSFTPTITPTATVTPTITTTRTSLPQGVGITG